MFVETQCYICKVFFKESIPDEIFLKLGQPDRAYCPKCSSILNLNLEKFNNEDI